MPADVHQIIAETVAAIQDPTIDARQACDITDLQVYAELVESLGRQARDACVAHLTCNGSPVGCDIDPMTLGNQACTVPTAEQLCDQVILGPVLAALSDLSNGPGAAQPQRDGTAIEYIDEPRDCVPLLGDTDGTPECADGGGALDASGSGGTGDGLDESGTEGSGVSPFGDLDTLVSCTSPTTCTIEPELFTNVQRRFDVFHAEGVWLHRVDLPGAGRGIQISGLDQGEASTQLLGTLGLEDGDVLTHVDGASLAAPETIEQLLVELPTATSWSLTVERSFGSGWETLEVTLSRAP